MWQVDEWLDGQTDVGMEGGLAGWTDRQTNGPTSGAGVFPMEQPWDEGGALGVMLITCLLFLGSGCCAVVKKPF